MRWGGGHLPREGVGVQKVRDVPRNPGRTKVHHKNLRTLMIMEFFRGSPRGGVDSTSLVQVLQTFFLSVKSALSYPKTCHPVRGTREAPLELSGPTFFHRSCSDLLP